MILVVVAMFVSSSSSWPSHGFADCGFIHFLLVRPFMFVSRDVSRLVDDVFAARLPLPAARRVEALLVRTRELGGVRQSAHRRRGHGSRDPCYDGRLPLDQLEDLGLGLLRALLLVLLPGQLGERHLELVVRDVAAGFLLDFAEDDVHVGEGDVLAVDHAAVLADLGPVLAVHLLAGGACVAMDGEAAEGLLQRGQLHRRGRAGAPVAGAVGIGRQPLGRAVSGLFVVRPQRRRGHVGMFRCLDFKVFAVVFLVPHAGAGIGKRLC